MDQNEKGIKIETKKTVSIDEAFEIVVNLMKSYKEKAEKLEKVNALLTESNDFYADEWQSWHGATGNRMIGKDVEVTENNRHSGGKLARLTKQKIKIIMEEV